MREIKFRAWNKVLNKMYSHEELLKLTKDIVKNNFVTGIYLPINSDIELMQYTGLKDVNEKEVCEGDIVKEKYYEYSKKQPSKSYGVIKRERRNCNLYIEWHFQDRYEGEVFWNTNQLYINKACEYEVIGNIYENPELLK